MENNSIGMDSVTLHVLRVLKSENFTSHHPLYLLCCHVASCICVNAERYKTKIRCL